MRNCDNGVLIGVLVLASMGVSGCASISYDEAFNKALEAEAAAE